MTNKMVIPWLLVMCVVNFMRPAQASLMYTGCVGPNDFANGYSAPQSKISTISQVGTVTQACEINCQNSCNQLSYRNVYGELNQDYIWQCLSQCKTGNSYSVAHRSPSSPDFPGHSVDASSTTINNLGVCAPAPYTDIDGYQIVDSKINVNVNDTFVISLAGASQVYLCGASTAYIYPSSLISATGAVSTPAPTGTSSWNAINGSWTGTGVIAKSGDFLNITYQGSYSIGRPPTVNELNLMLGKYGSSDNWSIANYFVLPGDALNRVCTQSSAASTSYIDSLSSRAQLPSGITTSSYAFGSNCSAFNIVNYTPECSWLPPGRLPDVNAVNLATAGFSQFSGSLVNLNRNVDMGGVTSSTPLPFSSISFSGVLDGNYTKNFTMLAIKPYDGCDCYGDNVGGYIVRIDRLGCTENNGKSLLYSISNTPTPSSWNWQPVNNGQNIIATQAGNIYLRINSVNIVSYIPTCTSSGPCADTNHVASNLLSGSKVALGNTGGQYIVEVSALPGGATTINNNMIPMGDMLTTWSQQLFHPTNGVVVSMYNTVSGKTRSSVLNFPLIIRVSLILYVAITGMMFALGLSRLNQKEAVVSLTKIGIIATLLSPNSWNFFYTFIFGLLKDGSMQLISYVVKSQSSYTSNMDLVTFIISPMLTLYTPAVWLKIGALVLSGFVGFLVALFLIFSVLLFTVITFKCLVICMTSIFIIALLAMVGPIFICFILFEYTSKMFYKWLKLMLGFAMQPLLTITLIAVTSQMIIYAFNATLYFTACKSCMIGFPVGGTTWCLLYWPVALKSLHQAALSFNSPVVTLQAIFILYVALQAANGLISHATEVAMSLATSSSEAASSLQLGASSFENTWFGSEGEVAQSLNMASFLTGTNPETQQKRQDLLEGLYPNHIGKGNRPSTEVPSTMNDSSLQNPSRPPVDGNNESGVTPSAQNNGARNDEPT